MSELRYHQWLQHFNEIDMNFMYLFAERKISAKILATSMLKIGLERQIVFVAHAHGAKLS